MARKTTNKSKTGKGRTPVGDSPTVGRGSAIAAVLVAAGLAFVIGYVTGSSRRVARDSGLDDLAEEGEGQVYQVPAGKAPSKGPADALVTIVEWSDFECPHCSKAAATVDRLFERFEGKVRLFFRHAPLPGHRNAQAAAEASLAAHDQGRFWDYHDQLFARQAELREKGTPLLYTIAEELDLDMGRFRKALEGRQHREAVGADKQLLRDLGQGGTPMFFVNGRLLRGAQPLAAFVRAVETEQRRAERLLASGTKRSEIYDALVRGGVAPRRRDEPRRGAAEDRPEEAPVEIPRDREGPGLGPPEARVHVVEFFDFQCPACAQVPADLHRLHEAFPEDVRIEFRQFPLPSHRAARGLSEVALAAHAQGYYSEATAVLFESQRRFGPLPPEQARDLALELVSGIEGVDAARLRRDVESGRHGATVDRDFALGREIQLRATPTIYVDGRPVRNRSLAALRARVEQILAAEPARAPDAGAPAELGDGPAKAPTETGARPAPARRSDQAGPTKSTP